MSVEFKEGAVCFADNTQWDSDNDFSGVFHFNDFQLNTIKQGDYIEASELDTEQKYNDAVEEFGLLGFNPYLNFNMDIAEFILTTMGSGCGFIADSDGDLVIDYNDEWDKTEKKRKITYPQLMAIGKLKQAMIERDEALIDAVENTSILSDALNGNHSESPNGSNCKTSKDYLNECIEVQNQRGEQYDSKGTGERSFAAAASAFNAMTGQNLKGSDVCLLLACVKAVRQYSDPTRVHEDSLLDLVSYASLWAEEINKEIR